MGVKSSLGLATVTLVSLSVLGVTFGSSHGFSQQNPGFPDPFPGPGTQPSPLPPATTEIRSRGADGVEFEFIPQDLKNECTSLVMRGTSRFKGVAFVMPRVYISVNKSGESLFEVLAPKRAGQNYLVRFGVYVPFFDEAHRLKSGTSQFVLHECDRAKLLKSLNQVGGKALTEKDPKFVKVLASLPVTNMAVYLDGVEKGKLLGTSESNVLHYQGIDQTVEFELTDSEAERLIQRLEGRLGLGIKVAVQFAARSANGFVDCTINMRELAASLDGLASGPIKVVSAQVRAKLETAISKQSLNCVVEDGDDKAATDQILAAVLSSIGANPKPTDPNPYQFPFQLPTFAGQDQMGRLTDEFGNPIPTQDPNAPDPGPGTAPGNGIYNVSAVVKFLNKQGTKKFKFVRSSQAAVTTYVTSAVLRDNPMTNIELPSFDYNDQPKEGFRAYLQSPEVTLPGDFDQGQTYFFDAEGVRKFSLSYRYGAKRHYFSKSELTEILQGQGRGGELSQVLQKAFPRTRGLSLGHVQENEEQQAWLRDHNPLWDPRGWFSWKQFRWGVTIPMVDERELFAKEVDFANQSKAGKFYIEELPVRVKFDRLLGKGFSLGEVSKSNALWNASMDKSTGVVKFTPTRDLGRMTLSYSPKLPVSASPMVANPKRDIYKARRPVVLFQEWASPHSGTSEVKIATAAQADLPKEKQVLYLRMLRKRNSSTAGSHLLERQSHFSSGIIVPGFRN